MPDKMEPEKFATENKVPGPATAPGPNKAPGTNPGTVGSSTVAPPPTSPSAMAPALTPTPVPARSAMTPIGIPGSFGTPALPWTMNPFRSAAYQPMPLPTLGQAARGSEDYQDEDWMRALQQVATGR